MSGAALEAFFVIQCITMIAALGHYMPLSMKQLDVGIAGYMMIGAYTSAILTRDHSVYFPVALAAGALSAGAGALVIDALATRVRLSGFAYAIFSLSFAESLRILLDNTDSVGGTLGLVGIPALTTLPIAAGSLVLVVVGFWLLDRTRLGQVKTAIADDEFIVPQLGIPLVRTKLIFFAMGGALGGLSGGLFAHYVLFIRPNDFGFALLVALQLPIVFGGLDRFYGALVGTMILAIVPEFFREVGQFRLLITAAATLLLLVLRPSGLVTHDTIASVKLFAARYTSSGPGRESASGEAKP